MSFTGEEAARLAEMRALIARWGAETFVAAPVIEPTDAFFPERSTSGVHGVRAVARRLLRYASLGELEVEVVGPLDGATQHDAPTEIALSDVDARTITLLVASLRESQQSDVPLVLAHEVARAYGALRKAPEHGGHPYREVALRDADSDDDSNDDDSNDDDSNDDSNDDPEDDSEHEDEGADPEEEHEIALTACYLGFGVLVVKGTDLDRAISPEEACFHLAAQAVVRGIVEPARGWAGQLRSHHAALLTRALDLLEGREAELAEALGLPPRDAWPPPRSVAVEPLPHDGWKPEDDDFAMAPEPARVVYRRHRDHGFNAAAAATVASGLVIACVKYLFPALTTWAWTAGLTAVVLAYLAGRRRRQPDSCTGCAATLDDESFCPRCGGIVLGELRRGETIADAEERAGIPTFGAAEEELAHRMEAALARGHECPECGFRPHGAPRWTCAACDAAPFDVFESEGRCPSCRAPLEELRCPVCLHESRYERWCP